MLVVGSKHDTLKQLQPNIISRQLGRLNPNNDKAVLERERPMSILLQPSILSTAITKSSVMSQA